MNNRSQIVPNALAKQEPPQEMVGATGSNPVAPKPGLPQFLERQAELAAEDSQGPPELFENRPQTVPSRRLTRQELRLLISVIDGEIGRVGLDQELGRRQQALKAKLLLIHQHGFEQA